MIASSKAWDIATFDLPEVFVSASAGRPKSHHHAVQWPPARAQKGDVVLYGGFPGVLREEKGHIAELPFQWAAGRVNDVGDENIILEPDFDTMQWVGDEANDHPGGWSGGPVFREVEGVPIARLELVGFIYEFPLQQAVSARLYVVRPSWTLRRRCVETHPSEWPRDAARVSSRVSVAAASAV